MFFYSEFGPSSELYNSIIVIGIGEKGLQQFTLITIKEAAFDG